MTEFRRNGLSFLALHHAGDEQREELHLCRILLLIFLLTLALGGSFPNRLANIASGQTPATTSSKPKAEKRQPQNWPVFKSPDSDFTLQFPRKPDVQDASEGPITLIRYYGVTTEDGTTFSINFHDIGGDPRAPENNQWNRDLEAIVSAADRAQNRQIVQTHRIGKNIVEAEIWQTENSGVHLNYLRRSILRRGWVYTLGCGPAINNKKVDKPLCERFFNSMRFTAQLPRHVKRI
jgi:hypothetical protein